MNKRSIGIDIDAVVANTNEAILNKLNARFGLQLQLSDMVVADFVENFSGLPIEVRKKFARSLFTDSNFYSSLNPIPGASTYVQRLANEGFEISYITSRPCSTRKVTIEWLMSHKLLPDKSRVFHPDNGKDPIQHKLKTCSQFGLSLFIEDRLEIANKMTIPVLLFDYPYNQSPSPPNVIRIRSWSSAYDCIGRSVWTKSLLVH